MDLTNKEIFKRVQHLLDQKGFDLGIHKEDVSVTLAGSRASGLATMQSDIDVRIVLLSKFDDSFGLHPFEHKKMNEGGESNHGYLDVDIEIFSSTRLLRDLYYGEIVANEIVGTDEQDTLKDPVWMKEIREHRNLFMGKGLVFKLNGFRKGTYAQMYSDPSKVKGELRKERIETFGYDPKMAQRSMLLVEMMKEYMDRGVLAIKVKDSDIQKYLDIKEGKWSLDAFEEAYQKMWVSVEKQMEEWDMPKYGDEDEIHSFMVGFHKKWVGEERKEMVIEEVEFYHVGYKDPETGEVFGYSLEYDRYEDAVVKLEKDQDNKNTPDFDRVIVKRTVKREVI